MPAPPTADGIPSELDLGFYRSPVRVAVCCLVAAPVYVLWWAVQLVRFGQRQGMPNVSSPWFLLVPFYNLFVLFHAINGINTAEKARDLRALSVAPVGVAGLAALLVTGPRTRPPFGVWDYGSHLVARFLYMTVLFTVQAHANGLQAGELPALEVVPPLGANVTPGEVLAFVFGVLITLMFLTGWANPTVG